MRGLVSAVYLNLRALHEQGALLTGGGYLRDVHGRCLRRWRRTNGCCWR